MSYVFALATRGVVLALPSTVIVLGFGRLVFGLAIDVAIAPVLLLCAYSLSGLGAVIGFYSPTAEAASMGTQVLSTILVFFAPVFLPLSASSGIHAGLGEAFGLPVLARRSALDLASLTAKSNEVRRKRAVPGVQHRQPLEKWR
ncbi:MAG: ABC transporter permease [Firmicutes bacterium]|nr:ABC transporter permease [Bacillota bacterium]